MAVPFDLRSLLMGIQTSIDHDESGDGTFQHLAGPYPLAMLAYFSSTIQQQCAGGANGQAYMLQPTQIHITKGSPLALTDVFNWMVSCCQTGRICALSEIVRSPTRFLQALAATRQLGVRLLDFEIYHTAIRLQNELLTTGQMSEVAGDLDGHVQEIKEAVIGNLARCYIAGRLPDVPRYLGLAAVSEKFYQEVANGIKALKDMGWHPHAGEAEAAWLRREPLNRPVGRAMPMMDAVGGVSMMPAMQAVPMPTMFAQPSIPIHAIPIYIPPAPQSVLSYCSATTTSCSSGRSHPHSHHAPLKIHIHGINGSRAERYHHHNHTHAHHYHHHGHAYGHHQPRHSCRHTRHERCDPLRCDQKTMTYADIVARGQAQYPPHMTYRHASSAIDTPSNELPKQGEALRGRRHTGPNHYLHIFEDRYGKFRYVSKGPGFRFEGDIVNMRYRCGCWLDASARRWFRDDGTWISGAPASRARAYCDRCLVRGESGFGCR